MSFKKELENAGDRGQSALREQREKEKRQKERKKREKEKREEQERQAREAELAPLRRVAKPLLEEYNETLLDNKGEILITGTEYPDRKPYIYITLRWNFRGEDLSSWDSSDHTFYASYIRIRASRSDGTISVAGSGSSHIKYMKPKSSSPFHRAPKDRFENHLILGDPQLKKALEKALIAITEQGIKTVRLRPNDTR